MSNMNVLMHNMQSMFTNRQLGITNNNKAKSTEKLSSGYKINRAADDAAGLTISEGMRRQIRGLTQGTKNTQDGISMCKIADGALAEVGDMMHRLTELSIKSANGTNTAEDREAIQEEVNQILNEIDRVSTSTTFNEHRIFASEPELKPNITINQANLSNTEIIENLLNKSYPAISQDVVLDDCDETISKDLANKFISDLSNFAIIDYLPRNGYTFPEDKSEIEPYFWKMHDMFKASSEENWHNNNSGEWSQSQEYSYWESAAIMAKRGFDEEKPKMFYSGSSLASHSGASATYSGMQEDIMTYLCVYVSTGSTAFNARPVSDLSYLPFGGVYPSTPKSGELYDLCRNISPQFNGIGSPYESTIDVACDIYRYLYRNSSQSEKSVGTNDNDFWIQSGAEAGNGLYLKFGRMNTTTLGINGLNVSSEEDAKASILCIDDGLSKLLSIRSDIGAQQNRLEHTIKHQMITIENTQNAESLIRDTDMATEMVNLSKENILQQSGQSMLAQTNQNRQGLLNLLQ